MIMEAEKSRPRRTDGVHFKGRRKPMFHLKGTSIKIKEKKQILIPNFYSYLGLQ